MGDTTVTAFDALVPIPELSIAELALVICYVRRPGAELGTVASEIGRWFNADIVEHDLATALRRLVHREWITIEGTAYRVSDAARTRAEFAARGLVRLIYRDRYFFDIGKLLDVTFLREDHPDAP
jgi:hypothetical protein